MSPSQSQSTSQHRVKVVRVLCDGCERTVADVYCGHCAKGACKRCEQTLHSGADCAISDLAHCAALLALCQSCRTRPAQRVGSSAVLPLCQECQESSSDGGDTTDGTGSAFSRESSADSQGH